MQIVREKRKRNMRHTLIDVCELQFIFMCNESREIVSIHMLALGISLDMIRSIDRKSKRKTTNPNQFDNSFCFV